MSTPYASLSVEITESEILNTPFPDRTTFEATDVLSFVLSVNAALNLAFYKVAEKAFDLDAKVKYLRCLYVSCVFNGKSWKESLLVNAPQSQLGDEKVKTVRKAVSTNFKIPSHKFTQISVKGILLACVIRGAPGSTSTRRVEQNDNRSFFHPVTGEDGKQILIPVVTYKLFQAIVSILVQLNGCQTDLPPARLGANVVASCLIPESKADQGNWAIHGHSGLNFVAKFILQSIHHDKSAADDDKINALESGFPSLEQILVIAYRMDKTSKREGQSEPKTAADTLPTVKAIFQTCQFDQDDIDTMTSKLEPSQWGPMFAGVVAGLVSSFAETMSRLEKDGLGADPNVEKTSSSGPTPAKPGKMAFGNSISGYRLKK